MVSFTLHGIGVSNGIAIGKAHVIHEDKIEVPHYTLPREEIDREIERFDQAIRNTTTELENLKNSLPDDSETSELSSILYTYLLLVKDSSISRHPKTMIQEQLCNAEWALQQQVESLIQKFEAMEDAYLRERKSDVLYVSQRVLKQLMGNTSDLLQSSSSAAKKSILVARDLSPADAILFKQQPFAAFLTDLGGATSHTAIIARSLNIPAIVALHHVHPMIRNTDLLVIDGALGTVIVNPDTHVLEEYQLKQEQYLIDQQKLKLLISTPTTTLDGTVIELHANIELPQDSANLIDKGATGVGLFRSEFLFLNRDTLPDEEEQFWAYRQAAENMHGLPVTIRTLDLGADKQLRWSTRQSGPNPALGLRAIRLCLAEPKMFKTQLRAILRASYYGNIKILIPMLCSHVELQQTLMYIEEAKQSLDDQHVPYDRQVKIGGMIEIPAAALSLELFLKDLDFISIGTNDLIQYTLAIDRADDTIAHLYDPLHPAIIQLLHRTITKAHASQVEVSVCGEIAGDVHLTRLLLGLGLRQFSMHPSRILSVKQQVLKSDLSNLNSQAQKILKLFEHDRIHNAIARMNGETNSI